ncbi:serine/threonine protein kinase [Nonomuraea roseoviolacea]|uniref:serine/threonine protein kinase n=1 Tax=Nonomuraea roseoviolacea TaxID=103837 RepID=UPI0020A51453|nr:serine/threonine-protein kinase [Nonomuraea roseoviolacea]
MPVNERSLIGQEVAGYYIEDIVGKGGMAVVYLALDPRLSRRVALKILNPVLSVDDRFRQRFILESRTVASIEHPNIIPIYEANADADGVLYISMRYVDGLDLRRLIYDRGPLPLAQANQIFTQVAAALDAAHAHDLIHRDVKPANILLAGDHVYLTDFGITKHRTSISGLTQTDQFIGTPRYMSPEQINKEHIDGRCDQYALACVVYEGLSGRLPFQRDNDIALLWAHLAEQPTPLSQMRPELPPEVDAVMERALAKSPEQRYPTCGAFVAALRDAMSGHLEDRPLAAPLPVRPRRPAAGRGGTGRPGRLPIIAATLTAAVAALVLVVLLVLSQRGESWARYQPTTAAPVGFEYPAGWTVRTHEDLFALVSPRAPEFESMFVSGAGADWTPVVPVITDDPENATGVYVQVSDTLSTTATDTQMKAMLEGLLPGRIDVSGPVTEQAGTSPATRYSGSLTDRDSGARLGFVGYVVDRKPKPMLLLYFCARNTCDDAVQARVRQSVRLQ